MRVEARYCDVCGVKIALDDLSSGDAVQLEESVFHCKECSEKKGSKAKAAKAAKPEAKAEKGAVTSSRRLLTRRRASGRLSRSKAKVPAALTASSDGEKAERPADPEKKRLAADRAKTRDKLEKKKTQSALKTKVLPRDAEKDAGADASAERKKLAAGDKVKKPKKDAGEKGDEASARKPDEASKRPKSDGGKVEKAEKTPEPEKAEKTEKTETTEKAETAEKAESAPVEAAESKAKEPAPAESGAAPAEAKAEKPAKEEAGAPEILNADSPPSSLTETPSESTGSEAAAEKAEDAKATAVAEAPPKKKAEKKADEAAEAADEPEGASRGGKTLTTGSGKAKKAEKPGKSGKDEDGDETSAARKKAKKRSGTTAVAVAEEDESAERKKGTGRKARKPLAGKKDEPAGGEAPKKKAPLVPVLAIGGVAIVLVALASVFGSNSGPKVPPFDRSTLIADLKTYSDQHPDAHDELVARWQGLQETLDGDLQAKANEELQQVEQRYQNQSKSAVDELDGKVQRALSGSPVDFDGALAAIAAFPDKYRGSSEWQRRGLALELDVIKRRTAFEQGSALLKAAKASWEADHSADAVNGLYAAYPTEYRETNEGKAIVTDFEQLRSTAIDEAIKMGGEKAKELAAKREEQKWEKALAGRNKIEEASNAKEQKELGNDGFEWQFRSAQPTGEPLRDAFKFGNGKLTIANHTGGPIFIGKGKRDWANFTVEFKIRVKKGTQVWFLGKMWGNERTGAFQGGFDKLPVANCATDQDKKPHFFAGIPDEEWVTLKYRCLGRSEYDVTVDGKETFRVNVYDKSGGQTGGFGFLVGNGEVEIDGIKAKVVSRNQDASGDDDEG